jgi:hypothetical protein
MSSTGPLVVAPVVPQPPRAPEPPPPPTPEPPPQPPATPEPTPMPDPVLPGPVPLHPTDQVPVEGTGIAVVPPPPPVAADPAEPA